MFLIVNYAGHMSKLTVHDKCFVRYHDFKSICTLSLIFDLKEDRLLRSSVTAFITVFNVELSANDLKN